MPLNLLCTRSGSSTSLYSIQWLYLIFLHSNRLYSTILYSSESVGNKVVVLGNKDIPSVQSGLLPFPQIGVIMIVPCNKLDVIIQQHLYTGNYYLNTCAWAFGP